MTDGFDVVVSEIDKSSATAHDVADGVGAVDAGTAALEAAPGITGAEALSPLRQFAYGAAAATLELSVDIDAFADALADSAHSYAESDRQADEALVRARAVEGLP